MKKKTLALVLVGVFVLAFLLSALFAVVFVIREVRVVAADFEVTPYAGLAGSYDSLQFGGVPPNGQSVKEMHITSSSDSVVVVKVFGGIRDFLYLEGVGGFLAKAGETRTLTFVVSVPYDAEFARHDGRVYIYILHPAVAPLFVNS